MSKRCICHRWVGCAGLLIATGVAMGGWASVPALGADSAEQPAPSSAPSSAAPAQAPAASAPVMVQWSAKDVTGQDLTVPAADRPTLVLFVRAGQAQSKEAIKRAAAALKDASPVQAVAVFSGHQDTDEVNALGDDGRWPGRIVLDPDYAASGQMNVHVWPTTVLVDAKGQQRAHLAGISKGYARELDAHLSYAAGKIDQAALEQKLKSNDLVVDSPEQMAGRHLQVAQRLLEKSQVEPARAELEEALKLQPGNALLKLSLAQVLVDGGDARRAMTLLEEIDKSAVPAWQLSFVRGQALVALEQWEPAKAALGDALKLNPNPAQTQYQLGLVYQHEGDWQKAAEAFRAAFEAMPAGKRLVTTRP